MPWTSRLGLVGRHRYLPTRRRHPFGRTRPLPPRLPGGVPPVQHAPTQTPIEHLVVLFDENVSLDHCFGTHPNATNAPGEPAFHAAPGTPAGGRRRAGTSTPGLARAGGARMGGWTPSSRSAWRTDGAWTSG